MMQSRDNFVTCTDSSIEQLFRNVRNVRRCNRLNLVAHGQIRGERLRQNDTAFDVACGEAFCSKAASFPFASMNWREKVNGRPSFGKSSTTGPGGGALIEFVDWGLL